MERDRSVQQACKALNEAWVFLRETVKTYTMKPVTINATKSKDVMSLSLPGVVNGTGARKSGKVSSRDPPNIDGVEPMELVENLDEMAFAVFATVTDDVSVLNFLRVWKILIVFVVGSLHHIRPPRSPNCRQNRVVPPSRFADQ